LNNTQFVEFLFSAVLNRTPSAPELNMRLTQLTSGTSRAQMAADFLASAEFKAAQKNRLTAFLLYPTLLFRDGSTQERAAVLAELNKGTPVKTLIDGFVKSPEAALILQ
jgi:hypothetical protein